MKRVVSLILGIALTLTLAACAAEQTSTTPTSAAEAPCFKAGFGYVNITPKQDGLPMAGYSDGRLSQGFMTYLEARAVFRTKTAKFCCSSPLTSASSAPSSA